MFICTRRRYWLRLNGMQQQLLTLFWREQGRPLSTTAMVISSFTCCWLPFFVWLLPFQIHPSLIAASTSTLDRVEATQTVTAASAGVFLARLAAFSNVNMNLPCLLIKQIGFILFSMCTTGPHQPSHLRLSQSSGAEGSRTCSPSLVLSVPTP